MKGYKIFYTYLDKNNMEKTNYIFCNSKQNTLQQYDNLQKNLSQKNFKLVQISIFDNNKKEYVDLSELDECTQPGMVDGGKVDVFTNNSGNFNKDDWYKQLFELNDYR